MPAVWPAGWRLRQHKTWVPRPQRALLSGWKVLLLARLALHMLVGNLQSRYRFLRAIRLSRPKWVVRTLICAYPPPFINPMHSKITFLLSFHTHFQLWREFCFYHHSLRSSSSLQFIIRMLMTKAAYAWTCWKCRPLVLSTSDILLSSWRLCANTPF